MTSVKKAKVLGPRAARVVEAPVALSGQRLRVVEYVRARSPVRVVDAAAALALSSLTSWLRNLTAKALASLNVRCISTCPLQTWRSR